MDGMQTVFELMEGVAEVMEKRRYAPATIKEFKSACKQVDRFINRREENHYFTPQIAAVFLKDRFDYPFDPPHRVNSTEGKYIRCVRRLLEFQQFGTVCTLVSSRGRAEQIEFGNDLKYFEAYTAFVLHSECSKSTKSLRIRHIKRFYKFIARYNEPGVDNMSAQIIHEYIVGLKEVSPVYAKHLIATLRYYFRFLNSRGMCPVDWSCAIPRVHAAQNRRIPKLWEKADIECLLSSIDRGNPTGKRDYAILLLVIQLGMRISDIANLKIDNINWTRKEIVLTQHKTTRQATYPLLDDVGWAIIDYLRDGRPKVQNKHVFLLANAPYTEFRDRSIGSILDRCLVRAGIKKRPEFSSGMHSLRHALARRLLEIDTGLPEVAQILGHVNYDSSYPYLQVDISGLRQCALSLEV